jgi:hypothetical protein
MGNKYNDLMGAATRTPKIDKGQLDGWGTIAAAYKELAPDVTYAAFRARILSGKSVVEAGTMTRSPRGRPRST